MPTQLRLDQIKYQNSLASQAIINSCGDVAQRGTSIALTTADGYTLDYWYADTATAGDDKTVSQQISDVNGSYHSIRVQRPNGQTTTTLIRLSQALESQNSIPFRGQKMTLSFYAKAGANFSASGGTMVAKIVTGKGTDQKLNAFTTSADAGSANCTLTTTSTKFTLTTSAVIASDITQIGVSFAYTPVGTASTNDWFEVTQVVLNAGDVALPFMPKSYAQELDDCQPYYEKSYEQGTNPGTSTSLGSVVLSVGNNTTTAYKEITVSFKKTKRSVPTIVIYDKAGNSGKITTIDATTTETDNVTGNISSPSQSGFLLYDNTSNEAGFKFHWTAEAEL